MKATDRKAWLSAEIASAKADMATLPQWAQDQCRFTGGRHSEGAEALQQPASPNPHHPTTIGHNGRHHP